MQRQLFFDNTQLFFKLLLEVSVHVRNVPQRGNFYPRIDSQSTGYLRTVAKTVSLGRMLP